MEGKYNLKGKTILITGCNRGIGKEAVKLFAQHEAHIIACLRKPNDEFTAFALALQEANKVNIEMLYFDMLDEESIKAALMPIIKEKRPIDVLINNAGIATGGFLQMTSMKQLKEVFQINFSPTSILRSSYPNL